jgi:hypothetical protein
MITVTIPGVMFAIEITSDEKWNSSGFRPVD